MALAALALGGLGVSSSAMASVVHRAAGVVLPDNVAAAVDSVQPGPGLRLALIGALLSGSMRLVRALRTGVQFGETMHIVLPALLLVLLAAIAYERRPGTT